MQLLELSHIILIYLIVVNILAFIFMYYDKRKAKKKEKRIAEVTLLLLPFIGGAIGLFIGMFKFRHKTLKRSFQAVAIIGLIISLLIYFIAFRILTYGPIPIM
ncbi:MAG: DUF1294 domain-containing protein [Candidatus Thorarchaeota archaeon]|jgi:uncharacterized membrane protein YsdA (DUF1294 family)|nr:DUF1294 domain-containing protein [Candidatus Thorarchaeota archaeon]